MTVSLSAVIEEYKRYPAITKEFDDFPFHKLLTNKGCPELDSLIRECEVAKDYRRPAFKVKRKGTFYVLRIPAGADVQLARNHIVYKDCIILQD